MPGGGLTNDLKPRSVMPIVSGMRERISVYGGVIVSRHGPRCDDGRGEIATGRLFQRHVFGVDDRPYPGLQDGKCLAVRQPVLIMEEAIIDELGAHGDASLRCPTMKSAIAAHIIEMELWERVRFLAGTVRGNSHDLR